MMRHVCIRGILGLVWLAAAIISGVSGHIETAGLYVILCGAFLYSAFVTWKKERTKEGVSKMKTTLLNVNNLTAWYDREKTVLS